MERKISFGVFRFIQIKRFSYKHLKLRCIPSGVGNIVLIYYVVG